MKLLRIDLNRGEGQFEELENPLAGGRYLTSRLIKTEVPPRCNPLGAENKLILACGPLAGRGISSAGRLSVGCKSPLTGGIKEANAGGTAGDALARAGLRAVVLEGQAPEWQILVIDNEGFKFLPATSYLGVGNFELARRLYADFGRDYALVTIGQAGEQQLYAAGVAVTDVYGRPSRLAARGGVGAVMGSKHIKAILIPRKAGPVPEPASKEAFTAARLAFNKLVAGSDRVKTLTEYGTPETMGLTNALGALPTLNFRQGTFAGAEAIGGDAVYRLIEERGGEGKHSERCMDSCVIRCSTVIPDRDGKEIVAPLEYETLCLMGSNLGVADLDAIARWNYWCNDWGLDTIEIGAALAVMAEAGRATFGDAASFTTLLEEIPRNTLTGRLLGMGAGYCGRVLGVKRVPTVKNQAISGYDPRGVKGTGITYITSPMGADHTAGLTVFAPVDHHQAAGQKELSRQMQIGRAAYDALGLCAFLMSATAAHPQKVVDMLNAIYNTRLPAGYLNELGLEVLQTELEFNRQAGMKGEDEGLPEFMRKEKLFPYNLTWDITEEELAGIFNV
ncbi:MAG: aldehyde:ferredoxin oxidoreductase [Moorella sp. (in: firmicutes)]|nr:aldehyde:ferredoxin oxidoreductase [Moorella sp. (in: firmicutes)]